MAKANKRASGAPMHSKTEYRYKIPLKDRKEYMGTNVEKWVSKKTYNKYKKWVKEGRKPR